MYVYMFVYVHYIIYNYYIAQAYALRYMLEHTSVCLSQSQILIPHGPTLHHTCQYCHCIIMERPVDIKLNSTLYRYFAIMQCIVSW